MSRFAAMFAAMLAIGPPALAHHGAPPVPEPTMEVQSHTHTLDDDAFCACFGDGDHDSVPEVGAVITVEDVTALDPLDDALADFEVDVHEDVPIGSEPDPVPHDPDPVDGVALHHDHDHDHDHDHAAPVPLAPDGVALRPWPQRQRYRMFDAVGEPAASRMDGQFEPEAWHPPSPVV